MSSAESNTATPGRTVGAPAVPAWTSPGSVDQAPRLRLPESGSGSGSGRKVSPNPSGGGLVGSPVARLGPRSLRQLLDGGFEVMRYRFSTVAALAGVLVVPLVSMPTVLAAVRSYERAGTDPFATPGVTPFGAFDESGWLAWSGWAAGSLAHTLLAVALAYLVSSWLVGTDPGVRESLRFVMSRLPVTLVAWLVVSVTKLLAFCGLGLLLLPLWALLGPVLGAERVSVGATLRRTLTLGRRTYGRLAMISVSFAIVSFLVRLAAWWAPIYLAPLLGLSEPVAAVLVTGMQIAASVILVVLLVGTTCLAYLDARARSEGLDIELAAADALDHAAR